MTTLRPAHETDLRSMYEVFYQNEISGTLHPPAPGPLPPYLRHVLQSGTMFVVEQDGKVIAFAGAIRRGTITFLRNV